MKTVAATLVATIALGVSSALGSVTVPIKSRGSGLTPITVKGNAFFQGNNRFYIRGVDYQPGGSSKVEDPISEPDVCKRDIEKFKSLGLNAVRVYTIDNSKNHDECMKALSDAGIYLILDVNTPNYSLNRKDPAPSYNDVYLQSVFATVEMFAKYDNTLAFFSANEVINDGPTSKAAPFVKAVTRDIRQFIRSRGLREVPVGYSAADIDSNRLQMAHYMNCGTDDERSDFFAFNDYSWCDPSSFQISGWDQKVKNFTGYGIPLFLSEYGCNTNQRKFEEVTSLYSTQMTSVYSGGLVYEYSQEASKFGLVDLSDGSPKELPDFDALKTAFSKTKNPQGDGGYNHTGGASTCPPKNAPDWDVDGTDLPALPGPAKKYMTSGAGAGPGLVGSSQNAGTPSSSTATPGSGAVTGNPKKSAANLRAPEMGMAPLMSSLVLILSVLFGASLVMG